MIHISERLRDLLGFGLLLILLASLLVVPREIPKEIQGDFPAEVYPRTVLLVGVMLVCLQLAVTWLRGSGASLSVETRQLVRTATLLAVMATGYGLILTVGFLAGGAFLVFSYAWLLRERNAAGAAAALGAPLLIYLCLEYGFRIRLPTFLDFF